MIFGIMGAMPDEVDQLCARLQDVRCEHYAGVEYHCGTLHGKQVVVCCAGMGKANAASTVQVLCTKYGIDRLIDLLDIQMPVNLVFFLMFCYVLVVLLSLSIAISQLAEKCKRLTQANAILEKRVRDLEEQK